MVTVPPRATQKLRARSGVDTTRFRGQSAVPVPVPGGVAVVGGVAVGGVAGGVLAPECGVPTMGGAERPADEFECAEPHAATIAVIKPTSTAAATRARRVTARDCTWG